MNKKLLSLFVLGLLAGCSHFSSEPDKPLSLINRHPQAKSQGALAIKSNIQKDKDCAQKKDEDDVSMFAAAAQSLDCFFSSPDKPDKMPGSSHRMQQKINELGSLLVAGIAPDQLALVDGAAVAIGSFVGADDLESSDPLGRQIQEGLYHSLTFAGIHVVDFKLTDFVRVTPEGDWVATRNYTLLSGERGIDYFVYGSMTTADDGTLLEARMVNVTSKHVIATSQAFLPKSLVEKLEPPKKATAVKLTNR